MATEAAWLERKESIGRKEKEKNILDSYRPSHGRHFGEVIERAFTRDKLAPTDRTFFDIATRHMELTFKDPAIVARCIRGIPVALFFAVTNARNVSPLEFHGHDFLGGHDFLRPTFNHRHSAVQDSLWLSHEWSSLLRQTA
jgi:hypothetical protein